MFTFFAKPLWMDLYLLFAENCLALEEGKNEIDAKAKEEKRIFRRYAKSKRAFKGKK